MRVETMSNITWIEPCPHHAEIEDRLRKQEQVATEITTEIRWLRNLTLVVVGELMLIGLGVLT